MKPVYKLIPCLILVFILSTCTDKHTESHQSFKEIFSDWDSNSQPGGCVAIISDSEVIYSDAFGLASMEYKVANTIETRFNIGSVSKQFTAMGIVLLHLEGKLSVDDDVRKYIPELNGIKENITLRHLLHHTSGLRSQHSLLGLAGWREDDSRTNEDLIRLMKDQRDLNFSPGSEYMYCNTGYILMAVIIERITGKTFAEWMRENVFEPLNMNDSYIEDNYRRIVPKNATSYYKTKENTYERAIEYWGYTGSGNMHSTVIDLTTWLKNFYEPKPGWEDAFAMLLTLDDLNNGRKNNYAFGVTESEYKGIRYIQHGGSVGGYSAFIMVYPEEKLGIAVISNFTSNPNAKAFQLSDLLLSPSESKVETETTPETQFESISLKPPELEKYASLYWNDKDNYTRKIYVRDDTLRYFRSENSESPLVPIGENTFQMLNVQAQLIVNFIKNEKGITIMSVTIDENPPIVFESFTKPTVELKELQNYCGEYFSPELKTSYFISIDDNNLIIYHTRHGYIGTKLMKKDIYEMTDSDGIIKFIRDNNGRITGLNATNRRVRNLLFIKRECNN